MGQAPNSIAIQRRPAQTQPNLITARTVSDFPSLADRQLPRVRILIGIWCVALVFAGCANPVNEASYTRRMSAGEAAYSRGDLLTAEDHFRHAVFNAQGGALGPAKNAVAFHNLGIVERDLCKLDDAERLFRQAMEREKSPDVRTIFELAHLQYERGEYAEASSSFELLLARVGGAGEKTPDTYAHVLAEYT